MTQIQALQEDLRKTARALSGTPYRIWRSMPEDWTCVSDLTRDRSMGTTSEALKLLHELRAVERRQVGREVQYRPRPWLRMASVKVSRTGGGA